MKALGLLEVLKGFLDGLMSGGGGAYKGYKLTFGNKLILCDKYIELTNHSKRLIKIVALNSTCIVFS